MGTDVLTIAVLAIVICAPVGATCMGIFGPRFLAHGDEEEVRAECTGSVTSTGNSACFNENESQSETRKTQWNKGSCLWTMSVLYFYTKHPCLFVFWFLFILSHFELFICIHLYIASRYNTFFFLNYMLCDSFFQIMLYVFKWIILRMLFFSWWKKKWRNEKKSFCFKIYFYQGLRIFSMLMFTMLHRH